MRTLAALTILTMSIALADGQAGAQTYGPIYGPWAYESAPNSYCLQGRIWGYPGNCQFSSYAQCMATASGTDAYCGINPQLRVRAPAARRLSTPILSGSAHPGRPRSPARTAMTNYPRKISFGELRETGVDTVLIYCRDHHCTHHVTVSADRWPDHVRLSDIEPASPAAPAASTARRCGRIFAGAHGCWLSVLIPVLSRTRQTGPGHSRVKNLIQVNADAARNG